MNDLTEGPFTRLFRTREGYLADKWEQYLAVYDREIGLLLVEGRPLRLLEIGVGRGGSLAIWERLLPRGSEVVGLNIDPACSALTFGPSVQIRIADATDAEGLQNALGNSPFDVIIDDGSHRSADVIATFRACFPRLRQAGVISSRTSTHPTGPTATAVAFDATAPRSSF